MPEGLSNVEIAHQIDERGQEPEQEQRAWGSDEGERRVRGHRSKNLLVVSAELLGTALYFIVTYEEVELGPRRTT